MRSIMRNIKYLLFFPLTILPIGMLLYALGTILQSPSLIGTSFFAEQLNVLPRIFRAIGNTLQTQTGLLAAIAISLGLSKRSLRAILSTIFVYYFMQMSFTVLVPLFLSQELYQEFLNIPRTIYPFHLIGGVIIAIVVSRFHTTAEERDLFEKLDDVRAKIYQSLLGIGVGMLVALVLAILWCYVIQGVLLFTPYLTGSLGSGAAGFLETLLRPFGITQLTESLQSYTYLGGTWRVPSPVNTNMYGTELIWLNQLQYNGGKFTVGTLSAAKYVYGMFVIPAIALAIINTSYIEQKKNIRVILLIFIIISAVIGYTLPIEIILFFTAPLLFIFAALVNGLLTAIVFLLSNVVNINLITLSGGGILDFIFLGVVPGVEKTGAWVLLLLGAGSALITYFLFYWLIKQFNLPVFGRNKKELESFSLFMFEGSLASDIKVPLETKMRTIIYALGGKTNIKAIHVSMYRLHVEVENVERVQVLPIKENGAAGVFIVGKTVQVIFGALTQEYYKNILEELDE